MVHGIMRTTGVTEDHQFSLRILSFFRNSKGRFDGSCLHVHVVFFVVFPLALCPAVLIQLHRFQLSFPHGSADLALPIDSLPFNLFYATQYELEHAVRSSAPPSL